MGTETEPGPWLCGLPPAPPAPGRGSTLGGTQVTNSRHSPCDVPSHSLPWPRPPRPAVALSPPPPSGLGAATGGGRDSFTPCGCCGHRSSDQHKPRPWGPAGAAGPACGRTESRQTGLEPTRTGRAEPSWEPSPAAQARSGTASSEEGAGSGGSVHRAPPRPANWGCPGLPQKRGNSAGKAHAWNLAPSSLPLGKGSSRDRKVPWPHGTNPKTQVPWL